MNNITQSLNLNGQILQIDGTIEKPLFNANKVIIDILGYAQLQNNWFYKNNKNDQQFIYKNPSVETTVGSDRPLGWNQHSNQTVYLTELGLYRCLQLSKKDIAIDFQHQIAQLLIDIRNGSIQLLIKKQCETTDILQTKDNEIFNFIIDKQNLLQQVAQLTAENTDLKIKLHKTAQPIVIYDKQLENGKHYIGSTNNIDQRNRQHSRNSSNRHLREAYQKKQRVRTKSLLNIMCHSNDDIKFIERLSINQVPKSQLLNIALPNPNMNNVTFDDTQQEEIKQQLGQMNTSNDYSDSETDQIDEVRTIDEQSVIEVAFIENKEWIAKFEKVLSFATKQGKLPSNHSSVLELKQLGNWVADQKRAKRGGRGLMNESREQMLNTIPHWIWDQPDNWRPQFEQVKAFQLKFGKLPSKYQHEESEIAMGIWVAQQKQAFKGQGNSVMTSEREELLKSIPGWRFNDEDIWDETYQQVLAYIQINNKMPNSGNADISIKKLAKWISHQKEYIATGRISMTQQKITLLQALSGWTIRTNKPAKTTITQ